MGVKMRVEMRVDGGREGGFGSSINDRPRAIKGETRVGEGVKVGGFGAARLLVIN